MTGLNSSAKDNVVLDNTTTDNDFENIVDISPFPLMIHKMGEIRYVNSICVQLFGYTKREELIGKNFFDFTVAEDIEHVIEAVRTATENKDIRNRVVTARIRTANGKTVKTETKSSPVKFRGEDCRMVVAHNYGLVEKYEEELKEKSLLLEKITQLIPDSIAIVDSMQGKILYENKSLLGILGYTDEDLADKDRIKFIASIIHEDDRPKMAESRTFLNDAANHGKYISLEFRMLDKAGNWRWIQSRNTAMRTNEPEGTYINFGMAQDITAIKEAEQALTQSKQFIEKVTATIPDHISIFKLATNELVYHNFYFGEFLGIPFEDRPESMFDLFTDDYKQTAAEQFAGLFSLKENDIFTATSKYKHRDGSVKYLLSRITPFSFNADGSVNEVLSSTIDITEAKEAELKTQRSERLYRTIAQNIPNGSVVAFDTNLNFTLAEGPLLQKQNIQPNEIVGKNAYESKPNGHSWQYMVPYFEQVLQGKSFYLEVPDPKFHYHILLRPLYDGETIYGGLNITLDVKEIKEAQSALTKSEEERKAILLALPDVVFLVDITGRIIDFYPGDSYTEELTAMNFVGMNVKNYIAADDYETVLRILKAAIDTGEMQTYEHVHRDSGTEFHFEFRTLRISDTQAVVIVRNVTSLRQAQNALNLKILELSDKNNVLEKYITSNAELERFAYIASHDLREPVRSIISFAQLVQRRNEGIISAESNEHLDSIINSGHRMYSLIHGLLDYSRITSDNKTIHLNDLNDILRKVKADTKTAAEEAGAIVTIGELPSLYCDELQIRQLFQNLLSNAIKFRNAKNAPLVEVSAEEKDGEWLFKIKDNGIGLDMKYKNKIFDIFSRLHTIDKYQGSGIGLALCKKIVERHGGKIWVESEQGKGTTFCFTIHANLNIQA